MDQYKMIQRALATSCLLAGIVLVAGCGRSETPSTETARNSSTKSPDANATTKRSQSRNPADANAGSVSVDHTKSPTRPSDAATASTNGSRDGLPTDGSPPARVAPDQAAAPVFRPSDSRPRHDDRRLAQTGIFKYESRRLKLYTDIDAKIAKTLPPIMDRAYDAWVEYFGPLPKNRERTGYQMTGYIMADKELFKRARLLPNDLPDFFHGRHRGAEFWMNNQKFDYYRRHLMIHEGTHCFMLTMPNMRAPAWYLEGMAELFGTHRFDEQGHVQFRVMPDDKDAFGGLGRIKLVQDDIRTRGYRTLQQISNLKPADYFSNANYAWSWALCKFLDGHPRYHNRFRELGQHTTGSQFQTTMQDSFDRDLPEIWTEWPLFAVNLTHGFDVERSAITFRRGQRIGNAAAAIRTEIAANRGWQSSGALIEKGRNYAITATGRFTLAQRPKPWVSEPHGISISYFGGRPLGQLLATIRSEPPAADTGREPMLQLIPIGAGRRLTAPLTGTLYFRVNDSWNDLANNSGSVKVEIRAAN